MKIQNLSVIFIVIAMPIILVLAYYISLQADTINMQTAYNTKLLDSTKEAIDAFEINTVEWNSAYSETADSKRRDVMASINTFTTSFVNNLGVSGTSKEYILSHVPAIAFTLYDGYYIYSPAETRITVKDKDGVTVFMDEEITKTGSDSYVYITVNGGYSEDNKGKILYKVKETEVEDGEYTIYTKKEDGTKEIKESGKYTLDPEKAITDYEHILKPFTAYSEKVKSGTNENIVVNYTLDNYITVYGYMDNGSGTEEYVSKSGYLTDPSKITGLAHNNIAGIKFNDKKVEPERLSEQIVWKEYDIDGTVKQVNIQDCYYVYEAEGNTKVYIDKNTKERFILNKNLEKISLGDLSDILYKKCTIPLAQGGSSQVNTYKAIYQNLIDGKWYADTSGISEEIPIAYYNGVSYEIEKDYSAINYCIESYLFTKWVNTLNLEICNDAGTPEDTSDDTWADSVLYINSSNNPDPESDTEEDSAFATHKKQVIKKVLENNLNQAITSYSRETVGEYRLPVLSEADWDQILRNVSIITFVQNIPIGLKEYNDYAIATSTVNKEYVDPDEIYLNASDGTYSTYYHMPECQHLGTSNLTGYRSIDYIQKSYEDKDEKICYYYKHSNNGNVKVEQACYECIVQRSLYKAEDSTGAKAKAYYTTLARERYVARMSKLPSEINAIVSLVARHVNEDGTLIKTEVQKIEKENVGATYTREAMVSGDVLEETSAEIAPTLGDFTTDYGIQSSVGGYSLYKSDAKGVITINDYTNNLVRFTVDELKQPNTSAYTEYELNPDTKTNINQGDTKTLDLDNGDATINIVLNYEKNYNKSEGAAVESYAVINEYNDLTIVSKVIGVTGKVRLRFTNGTKTYYSRYIFDIKEAIREDQRIIYCRIKDNAEFDTAWYENEWSVEVVPVDNGTALAGSSVNYIKYYAIREKAGLKDFADAVNGTKGPNIGAITLGRKFKLIADIIDVGTMAPIAGKSGKWFNGIFEGQDHTISGITIDTDVDKYNAFGLFGWVGAPATIQDLNISNINIDLNGKEQKENYRAGGLAAFCDSEGSSTISNIHVTDSNIKGTAWAGGIVGENRKSILGCSVANTTILSVGKSNSGMGKIYVGGITGNTTGQISGNGSNKTEVKSSDIGNGNVIMKTDSINILTSECNRYYVGGITGYTNNNITNSSVSDNSNVKGGKIQVENSEGELYTDSYGATYAGGVIGYKESSQEVNNAFQTNCSVSGHDNVGGMIGFNAGGNITGITRTGTVSGNGENVGGIVGCNTGGNITNCTNTATIEGTGKNVGGIVGCNNKANIIDCKNENTVAGDKNVGGIAGITYSTTIRSCYNYNNIQAEAGFGPTYWIMWEEYTGAGGIAGKLYASTVEQSSNSGTIQSTINVGGIAGLNWCSKIYYSYNKGNVKATSELGQVGGICGHGSGVNITGCYNTGTIEGKSDIAGIMGSCVNDTKYPDVNLGYYEGKLFNKYVYLDFTPGEIHNNFEFCYNAGEINDTSLIADDSAGILGKRMVGFNDLSMAITFVECYYLDNVKHNDYKIPATDYDDSNVHRMQESTLKKQLYKWTNTEGVFVKSNPNTYVYNTVTPLRDDLGYKGFGVLWWEIPDYQRLETNMFLCARSKTDNSESYRNFQNTAFDQKIFLNDTKSINYRDLEILDCRIEENKVGTSPVGSISEGCYRYIMMVPKSDYIIKPRTNADETGTKIKTKLYNGNDYITENTEFSVTINTSTTLWIAYVITTETQTIIPNDWSFSFRTDTGLYPKNWYTSKNTSNKYQNAFIRYDPGDSMARTSKGFNGGYVLLDEPAKVQYRASNNNTRLYFRYGIWYGPFNFNYDNSIKGNTEVSKAQTSDKISAEGNAYVEFGSLSEYGASNSTAIYNAELELTFDVDMKWDGSGRLVGFFNKIFRR